MKPNEPNKPKTFEEKALSGIPPEVLQRVLGNATEDMGGLNSLEAIFQAKGKPLPVPVQTPQKEQSIMVAIDGDVIQMPADPFKSLVTMLAYYMATVGYKDKKVNKILKAFNFKMNDANGVPIYPKEKKK